MSITRFSRQEFFDLIWSKPLRSAAAEIGISDVGLRKAALKADMPLPPRGHWNRIAAGKKGFPKPALPQRGFGATDEITFGSEPQVWPPRPREIGPPPLAPEFDESMDAVRERAVDLIGRAGAPRDLERCHPAIRNMLAEEERRAAKARESSYLATLNPPRLSGPADRRRLRIANAIALAVARAGLRGAMRGVEDVAVGYGSDGAWLKVSVAPNPKPRRGERADGLQVAIGGYGEPDVARFADAPERSLESRIAEIAVEIAVEIEARYRAGRIDAHHREVRARETRIKEARLAALEAERKERERREALERQRVERLLAQAERLRQADAIRAFAAEVGRRIKTTTDAYGQWSAWAQAQADRIDPTRDHSFLGDISDADETPSRDSAF